MFETATLPTAPGGKRFWSTCAGITGESLLVGLAMLTPLVWPQILPRAQFATWLAPPSPPPPPPPNGEAVVRPRGTVRERFQFREGQLMAYTRMPAKAAMIEEPPELGPTGPGVQCGVPGGVRNGVPGGLLTDLMQQVAPPPPPPPAPSTAALQHDPRAIPRLTLGGNVLMGRLIQRVEPVYPRMAQQMRVAGVVELEAVVGTDGRVRELKVLGGHPLLVRAAVEAVRHWVFQPTLLNGDPVEVTAPIKVTFRLGQ